MLIRRFMTMGLAALALWTVTTTTTSAAKLKALIVDGQMNRWHGGVKLTPILKEQLRQTGLFDVDVATSPTKGKDMSGFKPDFAAYGVVITNYDGDAWSPETQKALVDYVRGGGGFVVYHAACNAFPKWKEYNEMIGLGGWNGRTEKDGPYVYWKDGKIVRDMTPGKAGSHGPQHEYALVVREPDHPITRGLPKVFMHVTDELYDSLRGPAENLTVLATAFSSEEKKGTGRHEPMLMTIRYGKGRVFHTALGHAAGQLRSVAFIATYQRGTEWAATGQVTQKVPDDFPDPDKPRVRE